MVAIILINWNGQKDTIECLRSLETCDYKDFFVVVCDNGSSGNDIEIISNYCKDNNISYEIILKTGTPSVTTASKGQVFIYKLDENLGFSKGNNFGVQFASKFAPDYYLLLNNDTIVESDFLSLLVSFQKKNPQFKVLTPLIHYYYDKHLIWNGGGNIYWGFRIYNFADKHESVVPPKEFIQCTYITGCALFFVPELLDSDNRILTEKFFFGEEDFEFGLRMKRNNKRMACVLNSIIYHKVGGSRNNNKVKTGHTFIHYLNRMIDMKDYLPSWQFFFYRYALSLSVMRVLRKLYKMPWKEMFLFVNKLNRESMKLDGVSKDYFLMTVSKELGSEK